MNNTNLHRDFRCGPKVGQIGPKLDKSGPFSDQNAVKSDLKKSEFVPFGANLTYFGPKSAHPESTSRDMYKD